MKKSACFIIIFILTTLSLWICIPINAENNISYSIDQVDIEVTLHDDGSATFIQDYTYQIDHINGAYLWIDISSAKNSNIQHKILNETIYTYTSGNTNKQEVSNEPTTSGANVPYYLHERDGSLHSYQIFMPSDNETRHFVIEYTVDNIITNYNDTAEFNWKVLGDRVESPVDVTGKIFLPDNIKNTDKFKAWAFGSPQGKLELITHQDESSIQFVIEKNPPKNFIEIYALFPSELVPKNQNFSQSNTSFDQLSNQMTKKVAKYNRNNTLKRLIYQISAKLCLYIPAIFPILGFFKHFRRRRQLSSQPQTVPNYLYSPPSNIHPALLGMYLKYYNTQQMGASRIEIVAGTLELARKKAIEIKQVKKSRWEYKTYITAYQNKEDQLEIFELPLYDFYYQANHENPLALNQYRDYYQENNEFYTDKVQNINDYEQELIKEVEKFLPKIEAPNRFILTGCLLQFSNWLPLIVMIGTSKDKFFTDGLTKEFILVWPIITLISYLVQRYAKKHPLVNDRDANTYQEWMAFKRMLSDIGNMNIREIASIPLWETYLIYAYVLGEGEKVAKELNHFYQTENNSDTHHTILTHNFSDLNSIEKNIAHASNTHFSSESDRDSGYGGGFFDGTSDGGGGGGAGAF
ncbi:DUF2207 domain-containing protein [Facklamia sp. DSM 111018]|uniref:DUF2207 domain-containing protein n=1 Tax=Facklamia lactis TaxID=2749967 RepID=A0ABS0LPW5_9LACT|nr:DUF2207 domain-containing protein [Facklamia lactis]MBG9979909.1 DUF2207 domain-containing protein [Facklamia lactis]MBG9985411.1 DUF2207 domain-containing protein [Facklamia lactis]